jgi:RNA polymerase sigma factor for flagellar operon FliA
MNPITAIRKDNPLAPHVPMVQRIARQMASRLPPGVSVDDLVQAGMIGLMEATRRFDEAQGVVFEAFATPRIRGAILDELRTLDWTPRRNRHLQRRIAEATARLEQMHGRTPTAAEMADILRITLEEYQVLRAEADGVRVHSWDNVREDEEGDSFLDRNCPDERENPEAACGDRQFRGQLAGAIDSLPEREKLVMGLYYEQDLNLREIAAVLGVTESRVCQLHGQAVKRLRADLVAPVSSPLRKAA